MIVFIGRVSVALGIIVALLTISIGLGSKKAIKERMADFSGHVTVKSSQSNSSYNSSVLQKEGLQLDKIKKLDDVSSVQSYATTTGIMRNEHNFAGIILKGVGSDFDAERFQKFIIEGKVPSFNDKGPNNEIIISKKTAADMHLKLKDSIVAVFVKENQNLIYRKFVVSGIYKTDIKMIDDQFVIGGLNHVRRILGMENNEVGGLDIFMNDIDKIDDDFPSIEKLVGYKNYAEKASDRYQQINDWIKIFDNNIVLIITLMLVVVIINIIMVLLILIIERTNSIGLLKTLGATNTQIQTIFINYTLMIMIPGLLVGNAIGLGLILIQKYFGVITLNPDTYYVSVVPVDLNPVAIVSVSLGILAVSALALIIPSYLISKISPVKAIKYE